MGILDVYVYSVYLYNMYMYMYMYIIHVHVPMVCFCVLFAGVIPYMLLATCCGECIDLVIRKQSVHLYDKPHSSLSDRVSEGITPT